MAGWNTSSIWVKVALVCLAVGMAIYIVGFATSDWVSNYWQNQSYGLWQKTVGFRSFRIHTQINNWFKAAQALECIGLMTMGVALLLLIIYMCVLSCKRRNTLIATMILTFIAVFAIMVGVAVFATKFEKRGYYIDWSMGVAIGGGILAFVSGIMQVLELCGRSC